MLTGVHAPAGTVALLTLSASSFYVGGMFLNDAFDREIDAVERPERPIAAGEISAARVFVIGFGLLAAGLILLVPAAAPGAHAAALLAGLALAGVIVLYNVWHKGNALSPLVMGLARALVYVTAAAAVAGTVTLPVLEGALILVAYLIGLTYVAKQETLGSVRTLWPLAFLAAPFRVCRACAPPLRCGGGDLPGVRRMDRLRAEPARPATAPDPARSGQSDCRNRVARRATDGAARRGGSGGGSRCGVRGHARAAEGGGRHMRWHSPGAAAVPNGSPAEEVLEHQRLDPGCSHRALRQELRLR